MTCHNAVLEAWPDTPLAQRLRDSPRNYDTLREYEVFARSRLLQTTKVQIMT